MSAATLLASALAALALAASLLPGAIAAPRAQAIPSGNAILHAPGEARAGEVLTLTAEGFAPRVDITLMLMGPGPSAYLLPVADGTTVADASGRARWSTQLPGDLRVEEDGDWWLSADDTEGHFANRRLVLHGVRMAGPAMPSFGPAAPPDFTPVAVPTVPFGPPEQLAAPAASSTPPPIPTHPPVPSPTPAAVASAMPLVPGATWAVIRDASPPPTPGIAATGQRVVTVSVAVRLRSEPSINGALLTTIPVGTSVRLLSGALETAEADFYRVQLPSGEIGYAALLSDDVAAAPSSASDSGGSQPYRLRQEPSTSAPIRALLPQGTRVLVLVQVQDTTGMAWARVRTQLPGEDDFMEGYVPVAALAFP